MSAVSSMLGNAVQTRIGYRQCGCGRPKCRHDRKQAHRAQKRVERQAWRKDVKEQLR